jgi:hypothetical protein
LRLLFCWKPSSRQVFGATTHIIGKGNQGILYSTIFDLGQHRKQEIRSLAFKNDFNALSIF